MQTFEILKSKDFFVADIIGNTISADLLSYVLRDVECTGIEARPAGWYRLFDYFDIREYEGAKRLVIRMTKAGFRQDVISAILSILNARYALTEQVIYHHAKCAASAMLGRVLQILQQHLKEEELYAMGDEGFWDYLRGKITRIKLAQNHKQACQRLLDSLKSRKLYKRVLVVTPDDVKSDDIDRLSEYYRKPEKRKEFEEKIEDKLSLEPGSVILFCCPPDMALKEAGALVYYERIVGLERIREKGVYPLNDKENLKKKFPKRLGRRVESAEDQYRNLWRLYVFVEPGKMLLYGKAIKELAESRLSVTNDPCFECYLEEIMEYDFSRYFYDRLVKQLGEDKLHDFYLTLPKAADDILKSVAHRPPYKVPFDRPSLRERIFSETCTRLNKIRQEKSFS